MAPLVKHLKEGYAAGINTRDREEVERIVDLCSHVRETSCFAIGPVTAGAMPLKDVVRLTEEAGFASISWSGPFVPFPNYNDQRVPVISLEFLEKIKGSGVRAVFGFLDAENPEKVAEEAKQAGIEVIFSGTRLASYTNAYENLGIRHFMMGYDPEHIFYLASNMPQVRDGEVTIWTAVSGDILDAIEYQQKLAWIPRIQLLIPSIVVATRGQRLKEDQAAETTVNRYEDLFSETSVSTE